MSLRITCYSLFDTNSRKLSKYQTHKTWIKFDNLNSLWKHVDSCSNAHAFPRQKVLR